MAIQMRRGNLADFDPTKQLPGEFAVTLDTDSNLNKRVYIAFAAGTVKQLMTVEDATAQMIEATDAATAEAEAWAHGNSFTATEIFTSAGSTTVTLAYTPSSITAVKINDVVTTAYTISGKVITFNTAPAVGSIITVIYGVSTSTDNAKYYKEQAADSASTASTKAAEAGTSATNAANSATTAGTKATEAGNNATLAESYAVGGTGTRPGEDSDNAEYYYEQARDISQSLSGALKPCGTVTYVNLPSLSVALAGDMYNVSDEFTTTNDFKEGAGHHINAGANVYKTIDNKWDILAGTPVTGVKGDKEQNYRQGNVNLTPDDIGAVPEPSTEGSNGQVLATDGQGGRSWQSVQSSLTFDNIPTQGSDNPVKSGGIFSTMAVPKYDAANRREYYEGGSAFSGNIDSAPTAGSNNAVASGGTKTYVDAVKDKLITENWTSGKLTDTNNFTFNGFTGTITNGWVFYSKSNSAIIINIFMYITNAVFTNRNNPYIDIKLPVKAKYGFDRVFAGVFGTGATVQDVYSRRAEDAFITVYANSDTIRLTKHNFVQGATDGVVVILTPEIIIPIV